MTVACIETESNDTYMLTVIIQGLEAMVKGFPDEDLTIVTTSPIVRAMAESRGRITSVIDKAVDRPHMLIVLNTTITHARLIDRAVKLGIPIYQIIGGKR